MSVTRSKPTYHLLGFAYKTVWPAVLCCAGMCVSYSYSDAQMKEGQDAKKRAQKHALRRTVPFTQAGSAAAFLFFLVCFWLFGFLDSPSSTTPIGGRSSLTVYFSSRPDGGAWTFTRRLLSSTASHLCDSRCYLVFLMIPVAMFGIIQGSL